MVIVDQTMPGMSGLEVLRAMAAGSTFPAHRDGNGHGQRENRRRGHEAGRERLSRQGWKAESYACSPWWWPGPSTSGGCFMEKRRIELELAQAQRMEAIGQLASGIAHEINTPTQYIGDNARFLQGASARINPLLDAFGRLLQAARSDSLL